MACCTLLLTSLCSVKYRFEVLYHNRREAEARYFWVSRWSKPSFPLLWFVRPFPWFLSRCRLRYGRRFRPVWSDRSHVWYDLCASVWNAVRLPIMPFSSELRRLCVFWGEREKAERLMDQRVWFDWQLNLMVVMTLSAQLDSGLLNYAITSSRKKSLLFVYTNFCTCTIC